MKSVLFFIFIIFLSLGVVAQSPESIVSNFNSSFKEIVVDVRGSRGGNGDVAAGYLTVMDLIQHYDVQGQITVLVDTDSKKILDRLAQGNRTFWSSAKVETIDTLPSSKVFDLYLALASPSGTFRYGTQLRERSGSEPGPLETDDAQEKKINVKTDGVLIVQTVLGNSENRSSINPHAVVRSNGVNYDMSPAGIGSSEAGIYNDYIATGLRRQSVAGIQQFILSELSLVQDDFSRSSIQEIIQQSKMKGAKVGLAYGISADQTQGQFMSYLKGLAANSAEAFCLVTPSNFDERAISDPELRTRIRFVFNGQSLPETAEPGKIYVVKTKTLPHSVFVGMMAYSMRAGLVPVGAGDGFMSAAINLGGPFVLTRVAWNAKNIANLKSRLMEVAKRVYRDPSQLEVVGHAFDEVYGKIDLTRAQALQNLSPLFETLSREVPDLSERIMNAAVTVREQPQKESSEFARHCEGISDPTLRRSVQAGGLLGQIKSTRGVEKLVALSQFTFSNIYESTGGRKNKPMIMATDELFDKITFEKFNFTPAMPKKEKKPEEVLMFDKFLQKYYPQASTAASPAKEKPPAAGVGTGGSRCAELFLRVR